MADKLTMKQLKAELDELRTEVRGMTPLTDTEEPQIVSREVLDKYESLRDSVDALDAQVRKLGDTESENGRALEELKEAVQKDIQTLTKSHSDMVESYSTMSESVQWDYQEIEEKVDRVEKELAEARNMVTGLRAARDSDEETASAKDREIAEMKRQMDAVFSRMTRIESRSDLNDDDFQRFKRERRNEGLLSAVLSAVAAGVALVIMALALAGMV